MAADDFAFSRRHREGNEPIRVKGLLLPWIGFRRVARDNGERRVSARNHRA
jgi:hypothetical protein